MRCRSWFSLVGQAGQQVAHAQQELAGTQDGHIGVAGLKVSDVERDQPGATLAQSGDQKGQVFRVGQADTGSMCRVVVPEPLLPSHSPLECGHGVAVIDHVQPVAVTVVGRLRLLVGRQLYRLGAAAAFDLLPLPGQGDLVVGLGAGGSDERAGLGVQFQAEFHLNLVGRVVQGAEFLDDGLRGGADSSSRAAMSSWGYHWTTHLGAGRGRGYTGY